MILFKKKKNVVHTKTIIFKDELQFKLTQAETKIKLYDEKWRQQTRSILTAKNELQRLEKELAKVDDWKIERTKLMQQLLDEQKKSTLLQEQLKKQGNFLNAFHVNILNYYLKKTEQ